MYEFENDDMIDFEGVSLQGYVETTYQRLVDIFGDPTIGSDMSDAEWVLQFKIPMDTAGYNDDYDFITATIAKRGEWDEDNIPDGIYKWHVCGYDDEALECVKETLGEEEY